MAEYLSPGVYVEDVPTKLVIQGASSSTGAMIGITQRGKPFQATFLSSWDAFLREFATGVESPFMADSDIGYAVWGFFQNGGRRLYLTRVTSPTAKAATLVADSFVEPTPTDPSYEAPIIEAKDAGAWGNNLKIISTPNSDVDGSFDVEIIIGEDVIEVYRALNNNAGDRNYWVDVINSSSGLLRCLSGQLTQTPTTGGGSTVPKPATFENGADGVLDIADNDYIKALSSFDKVDDITLIAIPGQTSLAMTQALIDYVENRKDLFALLDAPRTNSVTDVRAFRKSISCKAAALFYPWIRVSDPLSRVGALREVPTAGHVMGVYARIISERGVWKAPAGTEANIRGALEVVNILTTGDTDALNPSGIVSIIPKPNYGIVVWGARSISPDTSKLYVSDILLNIMIKKSIFNSTQPFVFEPNNERTWTRVVATVESFLYTLWIDGGLYGSTPDEAYFVRCDAELNPEASRAQGKLIIEVGYASSKPAEFVIFRINHDKPTNV